VRVRKSSTRNNQYLYILPSPVGEGSISPTHENLPQNRETNARPACCIVGLARRFLNFGDSYTCTYCLQVIKWDHHRTRPTKDHFFPKSKKELLMGAKTTFVICCQPCNSRKSDKLFSSIEEVREFIASRKGNQPPH
jgi:5-methylcytosine-specific restriction endonuclease McrA